MPNILKIQPRTTNNDTMKNQDYKLTKGDFSVLSHQINQMTPKVIKLAQRTSKMIVMVGATGSGKSTIISILQGAPLKFLKVGGGKWKIDHEDHSGKYPKIGHDKESCTTLPDVYEGGKKVYIDLAGWFDTRTPKQQIVNGLSNSMVFTPGKQLKIVIVVQATQLTVQRGGVLVQIADRMIQFYQQDFLTIVNSVVLVITKASVDQWKIEDVKHQISETCRLNQNLKRNTKHLLTTLIQNSRIAIFPKPEEKVPLDDYIEQIKKQISLIRGSTLSHNGCVTLSDKAVNVVNDCLYYLNNDLNQMAGTFGDQLERQLNKRQFKSGKQANKMLTELNMAKGILDKELAQCVNLEQYENLLDELVSKLPVKKTVTDDIKRNFTMIKFYLKINKKAKIEPGFMQVIKSAVQNSILKIQSIRDKLVGAQERKQMEQKFKKDMDERQKRNKQHMNQIKQQMKEQKQEMEKRLQQDRKIYQEQMKNQNELKERLEREIQDVRRQNQNKVAIQQEDEGFFSSLISGIGNVVKTAITVMSSPLVGMFMSKKTAYDEQDF